MGGVVVHVLQVFMGSEVTIVYFHVLYVRGLRWFGVGIGGAGVGCFLNYLFTILWVLE